MAIINISNKAILRDIESTTKFLKSPSGTDFALTTTYLKQLNPTVAGSNVFKEWNPATLISQAGANAVGKHFVNFGTTPRTIVDEYHYSNLIKNQKDGETTMEQNFKKKLEESSNENVYNSWTFKQLTEDVDTLRLKDFRSKISTLINPETNLPYKEGFTKFNTETRIGMGQSDFTLGKLPPYYSADAIGTSPKTKIVDRRFDKDNAVRPPQDWFRDNTRDLIRFRFELVDNDNPNFGTFLAFRATITGLTDSYAPSHNSTSYMGRSEDFSIYQSTSRSINFNYKVYAGSKDEMRTMWQKLNTLASSTYGDYKKNKLRGSLHKVTIGDYLENQPCIITSLSFTVPDEVSWVIALNTQGERKDGASDDEYTLPMGIDVSMTLKPIHNFLPQKSLSKSFFVLPNEYIKTEGNLGWVKNDLGVLENSIKSNQVVKTIDYTGQYKEKGKTKNSNLTGINVDSVSNAELYKNLS